MMILESKRVYDNLHMLHSVFILVTLVVGWCAIHFMLYIAHCQIYTYGTFLTRLFDFSDFSRFDSLELLV